ncbi:MAG: TetR/AcrR family transcriptional regulator [Cyclobacteriaceae bacterium]|jgi:AcrR family transcriptional regulator
MSPRTTSKNEEIRQESMKKIMDAAFSLIAKQGYESTSIAQIAKEAGVSKGLMYNYFDSKEDLLEKLVNGAMSEGDKVIGELLSEDPKVTLQNIIEWFFKELKERPEYWTLMTELTFRIGKFKFVHDMATAKMKGYTTFLTELLQQLNFPNSEGEAKLIGALFDGIAIQYLVIKEDYPLAEMEIFLIEKYCVKHK